jgi:hypothetical protein
MAKELIYLDDARRAVLKFNPDLAFCLDGLRRVDAVEVVHGHWFERHMGELLCSVCEEKVMCVGWLTNGKYNYCPNCGAKMDGDGNEK